MRELNFLRKSMPALCVIALALTALPVLAQQSIVQDIKQGCANELNTYCKDVSAGEGRVASCL